jgi:hypothetical protein
MKAAFRTLNGALCATPILAYPQRGERFITDKDASKVGIGARPIIDQAADLVDRLHNIHIYALQYLKLASDRIKTRYNRLAK